MKNVASIGVWVVASAVSMMAGCAPVGDSGEATAVQAVSSHSVCLPTDPACRPCPPNQICPMIACICATPPGQGTCTYIAACIQGYVWNDRTCSCVPAH